MANLSTATSAERETVADLTKTIAALSEQLAAKDVFAKAKYAEIKCLAQLRAPAVVIATAAPAATKPHANL
jgi:hypothetical protein